MSIEFWLMKFFDRGFEFLRQIFKKQENLKQNSIDLVRAFEDFDIWLDKILDQFEKEVLKTTHECNLHGMLRSSVYLQLRFEMVKKHQNDINEYWLKNIEREIEDFLRICGRKNLNDIKFLEKKEKIKQITTKKENAIDGLSDKTLNELKKMGFSEIDIDGARKRVWKNLVNVN